MSAGRILTLGLGSFGGAKYLPTLGYLGAAAKAKKRGAYKPLEPWRQDEEDITVVLAALARLFALWVRLADNPLHS